jgi:hypothetical protein
MPPVDVRTIAGKHTEAVMVYPNRQAAEAMVTPKGIKNTGGQPAHKQNFEASLKAGATHVRQVMKLYDVRPAQGCFDIDTHGMPCVFPLWTLSHPITLLLLSVYM